jgi:hypothetical protein
MPSSCMIGAPVMGIHFSGASSLFPTETGTAQRLIPRPKGRKETSGTPKGKTLVPSNQRVSQSKLDMVKARLPESQDRVG